MALKGDSVEVQGFRALSAIRCGHVGLVLLATLIVYYFLTTSAVEDLRAELKHITQRRKRKQQRCS